jgi:hypothetical protein
MPDAIYKYLIFNKIPSLGKTTKWQCETKHGAVLGHVAWYTGWRQYCYFPDCQAVYSAGCLNDIADFLGKQNRPETNQIELQEASK